jgi:hypothetical protein
MGSVTVTVAMAVTVTVTMTVTVNQTLQRFTRAHICSLSIGYLLCTFLHILHVPAVYPRVVSAQRP